MLFGQIFLLGFVWGMFKPCIDHKENEEMFWNEMVSRYEGSGSR